MRKPFLFFLVAASVLSVVGLWSYSQAVGGVIEICIRRNGAVFVIGEGFRRADCRRNDTLMTWNVIGAPGPKGDKGDPGSSLHLFDANGQDLGIFLGSDSPVSIETFVLGPNVKVSFSTRQTNPISSPVEVVINARKQKIFFESNDCSSGAFLITLINSMPFIDGQTLTTSNELEYFRVTNIFPNQLTINSFLNPINNDCQTYQEATTTNNYTRVERLERIILPFTFPIAWPLEIREN